MTNFFLESVCFLEKYHNVFQKGDMIPFRPGVNILVGEQGAGKSSLLRVLSENKKKIAEFKMSKECPKKGVKTFCYDFEKDNHRVTDRIKSNIDIFCRWISHGEFNMFMIKKMPEKTSIVFLLDEPDSALSIRSCVEFVGILKKIEKKSQVIIAVHSPVVMLGFDDVYDLNLRRYISSREYVSDRWSEVKNDGNRV